MNPVDAYQNARHWGSSFNSRGFDAWAGLGEVDDALLLFLAALLAACDP